MKRIFLMLLIGFSGFFLVAWLLSLRENDDVHQTSQKLEESWAGFKAYFIRSDGAVVRPHEQDITSEGQANAMLRAVVMGDHDTFERVFQWTQNNLSRKKTAGDNLLSWHYKDNIVQDTMPATDADIDYALALLLASEKWKNDAYKEVAQQSLKDILDRLTVVFKYRRYLLPWFVESPANQEKIPQNLSYYSPAYFKLFNTFDHDPRWLELVDTTYILLLQAQNNFEGTTGCGLVPDWCVVDRKGSLHRYEARSSDFSWEAVRVPFRIGIDAFLYNDPRAIEVLSGFANFATAELDKNKKLVSGYSYECKPLPNTEESPLIYAAFYMALELTDNRYASENINKLRQWFHRSLKGGYYKDTQEYYLNSLVWVAELLRREKIHDQK